VSRPVATTEAATATVQHTGAHQYCPGATHLICVQALKEGSKSPLKALLDRMKDLHTTACTQGEVGGTQGRHTHTVPGGSDLLEADQGAKGHRQRSRQGDQDQIRGPEFMSSEQGVRSRSWGLGWAGAGAGGGGWRGLAGPATSTVLRHGPQGGQGSKR
jgi:hypothetical protein